MGRAVSVEQSNDNFTTADDWFISGFRVYFDPNHKKIVQRKTDNTIGVFERTVLPSVPRDGTRWITMLPGFPDGSYGYAKVDQQLGAGSNPRLYIEYIGQGDSDKPKKYPYSTVERADLVEAQWKSHGIKKTVLVTFDYSSIVMLELLQRQKERLAKGIQFPRIEHVLAINGGLFADGHTHPYTTTPLLKTRFGKMGSSMAQKSDLVFDMMLKPLYSKEYRASKLAKREMRETEKAIRLNKGTSFMSNAAGFVDEHKQNEKRWDLYSIYVDYCQDQGITFHLVGSEKDPFEYKQIQLARERLGAYYPSVKIETIPGGHLSTAEQANKIAEMIQALARKGANGQPTRSWTDIDQPRQYQ